MLNWLKRKPAPLPTREPAASFFSTHALLKRGAVSAAEAALAQARSLFPKVAAAGAQDDATSSNYGLKLNTYPNQATNPAVMDWYALQGFIGWQACALLMQNWLVDRAISMPARDSTRNGWDNVRVDGERLSDAHAKLLKQYDKAFRIKFQAAQLARLGRAFGIRIALFKVDSTDPDYYLNPFNPDGVEPGSYKGIAQVDPYWCAPLLDAASSGDPASIHFYEPTYWMIGGMQVHRTHLHIFRTPEPPDVLKPMYLYGGIPVTQLIMERVYAAERTANEAPLLAQSKRTNVWLTDMSAFQQAGDQARDKIQEWVAYRDNYGIKLGDKEADQFAQFETSLADLDSVIMTQYQLVAAASGVPATKLLGTQPKGFNSTGEYEEANYHEFLESIQEHDLTPFIERHHMLVLRSHGIKDVETTVSWRPLDAPTAKELADTNQVKAQTDSLLAQVGAIDGEDIRRRLATDPDSGYAQLGVNDGSGPDDLGLSDAGTQAAEALGLA